MNCRCFLFSLVLCAASASAAEPDPFAPLDDALRAVADFAYGKDSSSLELVEQIVIDSASVAARRAPVEQRLLQTLKGPCSRDGKEFLCRQLFTIGSARSIPLLEELLTDSTLSHLARAALERNPSPAACAALHRALSRTSGQLQAGILSTLGARGYQEALPDIAQLLRSPEPILAAAAANALGCIGGHDAVGVLEAAQTRAHEPLRTRIDYALLACAAHFAHDRQSDGAERLYEAFYAPDQPKNLRIAALRGLVALNPEQGLPRLIEVIQGPDAVLRATAIDLTTRIDTSQATASLAGLLPNLNPPDQVLLLLALAARNDERAGPAVELACGSPDETVRAAACEALGSLGKASSVPLLVRIASTGSGLEQTAARRSLLRIQGSDVDSILAQSLTSFEPASQLEVIHALAGRRAAAAVDPLLKLARSSNDLVRLESIRALGALTDEHHFCALLGLLLEANSADELEALEQAVTAACHRLPDPTNTAPLLLTAYSHASEETKPSLLRLLGSAPTPDSLRAVRLALNDPKSPVREAAVRTLAQWPNPIPAEDLLGVVRSSSDAPMTKTIALRGYVRLAGLARDPEPMYARALENAHQLNDKKLVLSSLGSVHQVNCLPLLERYLHEEPLRPEAALAIIQIAGRVRQNSSLPAKAALKRVLIAIPEGPIHQQALDLLHEMEPHEAHILAWVVAGPYREKDQDARAIFDRVFPPELPGSVGVKWNRVTRGIGPWQISLTHALGWGENVVGYARTRVWSPIEQGARLELGSDDGIKAWLNGTLVHANNTERALAPRQDIVRVRLREGWNELLLKVTNCSGVWGFSCRFRLPDGTALDTLKVQAQ